MDAARGRRSSRLLVAVVVLGLGLGACSGSPDERPPPKAATPTPPAASGDCGTFTIAYDPSNGYEASAFVVGSIATTRLGCDVRYVKTSSRKAWRLVARGDADVYLDAYGNRDLRRRLTGRDGQVTVVGKNGVRGGVDLLAPYFMAQHGLDSFRDLDDPDQIGWGGVTPAITTVPELLALAHALIDHAGLDYAVRDFTSVGVGGGMSRLLQQAKADDATETPNLYLVEGPLEFLGDGAGRQAVDLPESAENECVPDSVSTLCSLRNFAYLKIANAAFARSKSPAFRLVFQYELSAEEADNILEIVELSGYDVGAADVASWINTHRDVWRRWLD